MNNLHATAVHQVSDADLATARLGPRFSRLDPISRMAVLAVEGLAANFDAFARDRIAICLSARAGSLSTDIEYWKGRTLVGGPSPTLFAYTLPSSAMGEIAIRHRLTGPNLCFLGGGDLLLAEAGELILRGDADACVCVACDIVSPEAAEMLRCAPSATVKAFFLRSQANGKPAAGEIARDTESPCDKVRPQEFAP